MGERRGAYRFLVEIILKLILEKWDGRMDCIDVTQDRDRWRAGVNTVMNRRVS